MRAWIELKTDDPRLDHCTLAYFGEVSQRRLRKIRKAYKRFLVEAESFTECIVGCSYFGPDKNVPVLLLPRRSLIGAWHDIFFGRLVQTEFDFRPHITMPDLSYVPETVTFNRVVLKTADSVTL